MKKTNKKNESLRRKAQYWQERIRVSPKLVRVQKMKRKWASCSSAGTVTLAHDLANQKKDFQDFVIAHELLHLKVPNHGKLFKVLMTAYVPKWRKLENKGDKYGREKWNN